MINTHCQECQNRTKLFVKQGKKYAYMCQQAKTCPFTNKEKDDE